MIAGAPVGAAEAAVEGDVLEDAGPGQLAVAGIGNVGAEADQALRMGSAEVVENHLADHAIDGDVAADAQRERCDGRRRERAIVPQKSPGSHVGVTCGDGGAWSEGRF